VARVFAGRQDQKKQPPAVRQLVLFFRGLRCLYRFVSQKHLSPFLANMEIDNSRARFIPFLVSPLEVDTRVHYWTMQNNEKRKGPDFSRPFGLITM
jgi:hypothetical protein